MRRKKVLLINGSLDQSAMTHRVCEQLAATHIRVHSRFQADGCPPA